MRYQLKFLQRAGLVSTLLIGGVLGGLTAPLPSEAGTPQFTLKIDDSDLVLSTGSSPVTGNSILGSTTPSTCSTADQGLGYTACYSIMTSTTVTYKTPITTTNPTTRFYRIQNAPNQTARLRVGDNAGGDNLSVAGVQLVPVKDANSASTVLTDWGSSSANTTEVHTFVFTMAYTFDGTVNSSNAGRAAVTMRAGGEFRAGPIAPPVPVLLYCVTPGTTTPAKCDAVGDKIVYSGVGTFSAANQGVALLNPPGSPTNSITLSLTVGTGSTGKSPVSFGNLPYSNADMAMVDPTYPQFDCQSTLAGRTTACTQTQIQTMTVTLKGPDAFVATGDDVHTAPCVAADPGKFQRLVTLIKIGVAFLTKFEQLHHSQALLDIIKGANDFLQTASVPADPTCPGGIVARAAMILDGVSDAIQHLGTGAVPADPAPPDIGTIVTKVEPFTGHSPCGTGCGLPFDAGPGSVVVFRGEGCNPCFDLTIIDNGVGTQTSSIPSGSTFPLLISSSGFPVGTYPWEVEDIQCVSSLNVLNTAGGTNITIDAISAEDIPGPVHVLSLAAGDTLTCTWRVLTEDDVNP